MPDKPYIGNFAERMGNEIEDYASLGFDLILGDDMLQEVNAALLEKSFHLYDRIKALNQARKQPVSVAFCIDTHDTGNPALWGEPLVKVAGPVQMGMRHFLSRFLSVGDARRPKYEVMGFQDLSYGLYQANISTVNLTWVGDVAFNQRYHYLENVFEKYRARLRKGNIIHRHVEPSYAWWLISSGAYWFVPFIAFMNTESRTVNLPITVSEILIAIRYDLNQGYEFINILSTPQIEIPSLDSGTCLLFVIHRSPGETARI